MSSQNLILRSLWIESQDWWGGEMAFWVYG